jgi:hypothetical protein
MISGEEESAAPDSVASGDHSDEHERSLGQYATVASIVSGPFGMLLGVGFILLPSATAREKLLVTGAALAISVAGLTGIGAWRSPRRFGLTMIAGGLAIVCLADLSIEAGEGARVRAQAAGGGVRTSSTLRTRPATVASAASHSGAPSASTTPIRRIRVLRGPTAPPSSVSSDSRSPTPPPHSPPPTSGHGATVYLDDLTTGQAPVQGEVSPTHGAWHINAKEYAKSLGYKAMCSPSTESIIYDFTRPYQSFNAEVGVVPYEDPRGDVNNVATFTIEARTGSGSFTQLNAASAEIGRPAPLYAKIPSGATALQLITRIEDAACMSHSDTVWGNPQLAQ